MSWKSFRVAIAPYGAASYGMWGDIYQKVPMGHLMRDDTGGWDVTNQRWMPVPIGGTAKPIIIHAQLFVDGGLRDGAVFGNCKILRNPTATNQGGPAHGEAAEPVSGVFGGFSGMGAGQMTYMGVAQPGDYFEVWTECAAWRTGQPAQNAPGYGDNTFRMNTHYGHGIFQGAVYDDSAYATVTGLSALQTSQSATAANLANLAARVAALETP